VKAGETQRRPEPNRPRPHLSFPAVGAQALACNGWLSETGKVMVMQYSIPALALGLAILVAGALLSVATAQAPTPQNAEAVKKQDPVPPATEPKPAEQAGTTEPSAKVAATSPDPNAVFVKGVLTVPGANTDVDTAPAKHWARTDADDQVPIAGYRLKKLDAQQRQEIAQELNSQRDAPTASAAGGSYAVIGAELPAAVALTALNPVPQALADKFTELRGTRFMRSAGKILIVDPNNNVVVGLL